MRLDHARTPPKPDSEIVAKAQNSSVRVGRICGAADEAKGSGGGFGAVGSVALAGGGELIAFV
jgi:hypothetical protein